MRTKPNRNSRIKEVAQLDSEGKSIREIARIMNISVSAVYYHKKRIIQYKLNRPK
jgi:DNA-binding CsgD family transcriptional regulator